MSFPGAKDIEFTPQDLEDQLIEDIGGFYEDPLGYVLYNFPWGVKGTPLEGKKLRNWQRKFLIAWGEEIKERGFDGIMPVLPVELSVSSGHGTGKSALSSMIIKFIYDTRPNSRGTVTANTMTQLQTKTWAELGKWHRMSLTEHWASYHNTRGNMKIYDPNNPEGHCCHAYTCDKDNSESFAGQHADGSTSYYLFDEASNVPDIIWEVSDGGMVGGEPMRFTFGNPTRNTGRFREAHRKKRARIICFTIDSRDVEGSNNALFDIWVEEYGEDSDFVRVRVRGIFPRSSAMQLISEEDVENAQKIAPVSFADDPLILGVDIARFGDDQTVLTWRRGRDASSIKSIAIRSRDTMQVASLIMRHARGSDHTVQQISDMVFIDDGGVGGGVVDRCLMLGLTCVGVNFASSPVGAIGMTRVSGERYANRRAEMWGCMASWLHEGGSIDEKDGEMRDDLVAVQYGYNSRNEILLESKEAMKKRGESSPDRADALALTFAEPVIPRGVIQERQNTNAVTVYDPFRDL